MGCEGVVNNEWDVVAISNLCQLIDIGYIRFGFSEGLCGECLGIVLEWRSLLARSCEETTMV